MFSQNFPPFEIVLYLFHRITFEVQEVQMLVTFYPFLILSNIFLSEDSTSLRLRVFLSNSLDFVLVWRRRLTTMFRAGGANAGQPWRDHSVINAQSSLPPTNFNYFIYNLQLHYLLPARSLSSCIIVQLLTESWTPVRPLGHQRS